MPKIAIVIDGEITIHACGEGVGGDFDTLCGIDANDPTIGHTGTAPMPKGGKIDCKSCHNVWLAAKCVRKTDFK